MTKWASPMQDVVYPTLRVEHCLVHVLYTWFVVRCVGCGILFNTVKLPAFSESHALPMTEQFIVWIPDIKCYW